MAVGFTVHAVLAAVLVGVNPWFGLFAVLGYGLADQLPERWVRVGLVFTALTLAASQCGGWPFARATHDWIGYLIIAAVNTTLVLAFTEVTDRLTLQNLDRGRMIERAERGQRPARGRRCAENAGAARAAGRRRPARPASRTSGSGWPARSTTRWRRG